MAQKKKKQTKTHRPTRKAATRKKRSRRPAKKAVRKPAKKERSTPRKKPTSTAKKVAAAVVTGAAFSYGVSRMGSDEE